MSRSPRRNLRMAKDALDDLAEVIEQHPDAKAELVTQIGDDGLRGIMAAREAITRAVINLETSGGADDPRHPA